MLSWWEKKERSVCEWMYYKGGLEILECLLFVEFQVDAKEYEKSLETVDRWHDSWTVNMHDVEIKYWSDSNMVKMILLTVFIRAERRSLSQSNWKRMETR